MRFRGMIHDVASMNQLHRILWTLAKMVKSTAEVYVFRLTQHFIYFIKEESAVNGGITVWARMSVESIFDEYNFEGLNRQDNEIQLEIVPSSLVPAFKSALAGSTSGGGNHSSTSRSLTNSYNAKSLKMKLTKKQPQGPCLSIEVEMPSASTNMNAQTRVLTHEVGVHVIPKRNWVTDADCQNPRYDVSLWLPPIRTLKNVVDKMKNMSQHVILIAEKFNDELACLKLNVENEFVSITTTFNDLRRPDLGPEALRDDDERDDDDVRDNSVVAVRIDVKKLVSFLASIQFPIDTICASFKDAEAAHLRIAENDFLFQFRIPAVNL